MARAKRDQRNGNVLVHRVFGESFYANLAALMDQQIAEMMKEPAFRAMVEEFNYRMFEMMARIAAKQMKAGKR